MTTTTTNPMTRWLQLVLGLVCMAAISSPQYVWALFTKPMTAALGVGLPTLQVAFSHPDHSANPGGPLPGLAD